VADGKHLLAPSAEQVSGAGHDDLALISSRGPVPVFAVVHECSVVRRTGVDLGSGELFVHDRPPNTLMSPNTPQKNQSSRIHELAVIARADGGTGIPHPSRTRFIADPGLVRVGHLGDEP
jgi:hypothetical protein